MTALGTVIGKGLLSARPAASIAGSLYYATDTLLLYRDNGSGWDAVSANNPMTTAGDIIIGGTSGLPTRLAAGATSGHVLTSNGSGAAPSWQAASGGGGSTMAAGVARVTSGDVTGLTSTTFADLTGCTVTITTGARRVLVTVSLVWVMTATGAPGTTSFDLAIDGTRIGQTFGFHAQDFVNGDTAAKVCSFSFLTDALTAASHTFKVQYKVSLGTMKVYASTGVTPMVISAVEQNT